MKNQRPLTESDKRTAFLAATKTFANSENRWRQRIKEGMSDAQLEEALRYELGIAGGRSATDKCPSIAYQCAGLKIWACWQSFNHCQEKPIFEGKSTIAMAREAFSIANPENDQLILF